MLDTYHSKKHKLSHNGVGMCKDQLTQVSLFLILFIILIIKKSHDNTIISSNLKNNKEIEIKDNNENNNTRTTNIKSSHLSNKNFDPSNKNMINTSNCLFFSNNNNCRTCKIKSNDALQKQEIFYTHFSNLNNNKLFTLFPAIENKKHMRWDNLLLIPIYVNHENTVIFRDFILWDKESSDVSFIREFCYSWLLERFHLYEELKKKNDKNTFSYNNDDTSFSVKEAFDSKCRCSDCEDIMNFILAQKGIQIINNKTKNQNNNKITNTVLESTENKDIKDNEGLENKLKNKYNPVTLETIESKFR